jgi:peptidoglycan/xylan/chitin deacetylase (PgdA/CDA1 family)
MDNMNKKILEIHEWKPEFESIPKYILEEYELTFDDGLYSQYMALDYLKTLNTKKIFFISTGIIRERFKCPSKEIISCFDAHQKAFEGNFSNYMNWDEILEINSLENFEIQGHSHNHKKYEMFPLKNLYSNLKKDTDDMLFEFGIRGIDIDKFCFPYNESYDFVYKTILIKEMIKKFYGNERETIEKLFEEKKWQK